MFLWANQAQRKHLKIKVLQHLKNLMCHERFFVVEEGSSDYKK